MNNSINEILSSLPDTDGNIDLSKFIKTFNEMIYPYLQHDGEYQYAINHCYFICTKFSDETGDNYLIFVLEGIYNREFSINGKFVYLCKTRTHEITNGYYLINHYCDYPLHKSIDRCCDIIRHYLALQFSINANEWFTLYKFGKEMPIGAKLINFEVKSDADETLANTENNQMNDVQYNNLLKDIRKIVRSEIANVFNVLGNMYD